MSKGNTQVRRYRDAAEPGAHRDLVLLNAGLRIWFVERASSIGEGIEKARQAINSGAARAKLEEVRAAGALRCESDA